MHCIYRNLKLVVEIKNSFWYGDFVQMEGTAASQLFIDDFGDIIRDKFYPTGNNAISPLKQIWESFVAFAVKENNTWWNNPFKRITDLPLLFEALVKILDNTEIVEDSSPFRPYLLDARTLDGTLHLPFINLKGEDIKPVSIIEIKN